MIVLPTGFDYNSLISDFYSALIPFIGIAVLFLCYRMFSKALGGRI